MKSIFEKAWIIEQQALNAMKKEFSDWSGKYHVVKGDDRKFRVEAVEQEMATANPLEAGERLFQAFVDVASYKLRAQANPHNAHICPECGSDELYVGRNEDGLIVDEDTSGGCHQCDWAYDLKFQAKADKMANATMSSRPRLSSCEGPTKKVWRIADSMPKASRKEVQEECVRQGIAYGTARTQYQAWFKASQDCGREDVRKPYEKKD